MKRRILARAVSLAIAPALGLAFTSTSALADTFTCTSVCNFGPGDTLDNLNVKNGGVATLDGTRVTGNIVVEDGGALYLVDGVDVEGNVQSFGGSEISVVNAVVGGSIQIKNTPRILIEQSTIEADVQLEENDAKVTDTPVASNTIGGNLQLYKNDFAGRQAELLLNDVLGNLQLVNNRGGEIILSDNYVESALQCTDNDSVISGNGNDVGDLECPHLQARAANGGTSGSNPGAGGAVQDAAVQDDSDDQGRATLGNDRADQGVRSELDDDLECGAGIAGATAPLGIGLAFLSACGTSVRRPRRAR